MNRRLVSSLLLGAFVIASTSTFTSCKDYDDDISDLRNEITSTATTLEELVNEKSNNTETEIAALNSQVSALETAYKKADADLEDAIAQATNDANGYADIQAAEAQRAAIAAATELVNDAVSNLQAGLDAANATIDAQGNTIQSLLSADVQLQNGIDAAQADATAAYNLAQQANATAESNKEELGKIATNLETINTTLSGQISVLGQNISAVEAKANQNAADILAQETALNNLKDANEQALNALNAADDVLEGLITKNQQDITALQTEVAAAKAAATQALTDAKTYTDEEIAKVMEILNGSETVEGISVKLTTLENAYKSADQALENKINALGTRVSANETAITQINTAISKINSKLAQLMNDNVNNLITSIIYQDRYETNVYAKVSGTGTNNVTRNSVTYSYFPYVNAPGYTELTVGHYNVQEWAGYVYATINPQSIDASKAEIQMENSLMEAPLHGYYLEKAEVANGHKIKVRALKSANGLWKLPVKTNKTDITYDPAETENVDDAAYALYTTYDQDTLDADGNIKNVTKKVYSHYAIELNPKAAEATTNTDLSVIGYGETCTKKGETVTDRIEYADLNGQAILGTDGTRVYKKYVECVDVKYNNATVTGGAAEFNKANSAVLQTVLAAENEGKGDTISLVCPEKFTNYVITLKYYVWNYDGTISVMTKDVVFNKVLWGPDTTTFNVTPDNGTSVSAFSTEFPTFAFVKGEKCKTGKTWSQEAYAVEATVGTADADINGAIIKFFGTGQTTQYDKDVVVGDAKRDLTASETDLAKIKEMQVVVDPSTLTPEKQYVITLTFYNNIGAVINNVIINYTLEIPTGKPNPWHIPAAFDSADKLTIAWADVVTGSSDAKYAFSGSFYKVNDEFGTPAQANGTNPASPYFFEITDANNYIAGGKYAIYRPTTIPATKDYVMQVPDDALNGDPNTEHVYDMTAGIQFFGLQNLISSHTKNGWSDKYQIKFLSPIRYSILGTKGYIDGKTYEGMKVKDIKVDYRQSVTINDALFTAIDPKEATTTAVHFFENKDSRVANTDLRFTKVDGNNSLFSGDPVKNTDGTYTLVTSDRVSVTSNTVVYFTLIVTDVWGAVTTFDFPVTVVANK